MRDNQGPVSVHPGLVAIGLLLWTDVLSQSGSPHKRSAFADGEVQKSVRRIGQRSRDYSSRQKSVLREGFCS